MTEWGWVSREGDKQASLRISEGKFEGVVYQYGKVVLPDPNEEYAEVNLNNVVSADPKDIDKSSFGLSYIPNCFEKFIILLKPKS